MNQKIIDQLASSIGRKDEQVNIDLAKRIVNHQDTKAVQSLVEILNHKDKAIQSNSIKVLYEIGERNPQLISKYIPQFMDLLQSKNNRLQWGGMIALGSVVHQKPKEIYDRLGEILSAAEKGSVISKIMQSIF